jgi:GTPase SAR1 family protein
MRQKIGAKEYFECSAKTGEGVDGLFEKTTEEVLKIESESKNKKDKKRHQR